MSKTIRTTGTILAAASVIFFVGGFVLWLVQDDLDALSIGLFGIGIFMLVAGILMAIFGHANKEMAEKKRKQSDTKKALDAQEDYTPYTGDPNTPPGYPDSQPVNSSRPASPRVMPQQSMPTTEITEKVSGYIPGNVTSYAPGNTTPYLPPQQLQTPHFNRMGSSFN